MMYMMTSQKPKYIQLVEMGRVVIDMITPPPAKPM
jgi:hypothetical protein